jgi:putative intracellular protease/amidase
MEKYGAVFSGGEVMEDGNIITGNGPAAAEKFAMAIVNKLSSK